MHMAPKFGFMNYLSKLFKGGNNINSSAHPPYAPAPIYPTKYRRICGGCNQDIMDGNCLNRMGTYFHPDCFRCHTCRYPITEPEFSLSGKHSYHKSCIEELTPNPKCEVCFQFIPKDDADYIRFGFHPIWSGKFCPSHYYDNTSQCCSCERFEPQNIKYYRLEDGRSLCLECMESAIMDTGECQPLYYSIRDFYEGMHMRIDQQIPMLLVEREALNAPIAGEGFHRLTNETTGLCFSCPSEEQFVTSIHGRPRIAGHRLIGMRRQCQKLTRKWEVSAILVLYGLPRLLTGKTLAHELMHAWLRLNGYNNLNLEVMEGICQVLAFMWLETEVMPMPATSTTASSSSSSSSNSSKKGPQSHFENKLGEFLKYQFFANTSPAYGGGFRTANEAVNNHIRLTGLFPV